MDFSFELHSQVFKLVRSTRSGSRLRRSRCACAEQQRPWEHILAASICVVATPRGNAKSVRKQFCRGAASFPARSPASQPGLWPSGCFGPAAYIATRISTASRNLGGHGRHELHGQRRLQTTDTHQPLKMNARMLDR